MRWLAALGIVGLATVSAIVVWLTVGGNAAGWIIGFLVAFALLGVEIVLGADAWYRRAPNDRARRFLLFGALALAVAGSVAYAVWPGTLSWYLIGFLALPLVVVLAWGRDDDASSPPDGADGPWTAP